MTINEQLRAVLAESGETHYRIGKETGIAPSVLDRFVTGETECLAGQSIDRLGEYFGLELRRKKRRTTAKQPSKKRATGQK